MFLLFPSTPPIEMVGVGWVPSSISSSGVPGILLSTLSIFPPLITSFLDKNGQNTVFPLCRLGYYSSTQVLLCGKKCVACNGSDIRPW
jgi:hypothetical protein